MDIQQLLAQKVDSKFRELGIPCPEIDYSDVDVDLSPPTDAAVFAAFANDSQHAQFVDMPRAAEVAVETKANEIVNAILARRTRSTAVHSMIERCFRSDQHVETDSRPNVWHAKITKPKASDDFKQMNQMFQNISSSEFDLA